MTRERAAVYMALAGAVCALGIVQLIAREDYAKSPGWLMVILGGLVCVRLYWAYWR